MIFGIQNYEIMLKQCNLIDVRGICHIESSLSGGFRFQRKREKLSIQRKIEYRFHRRSIHLINY